MYYFWPRMGNPAGITVTKRTKLPEGDFGITEYTWGNTSLWFLNDDKFNADERQEAYLTYLRARHLFLLRGGRDSYSGPLSDRHT